MLIGVIFMLQGRWQIGFLPWLHQRVTTRLDYRGGEPTLGRDHLTSVLQAFNPSLLFVLETNGILLGADRSYVEELSSFSRLHVRVSLKGCAPDEFSQLTDAHPSGYALQLQALRHLRDSQMRFNIAVMTSSQDISPLFHRLADMGLGSIMLEEETVTLYPPVRKRLREQGLLDYFE